MDIITQQEAQEKGLKRYFTGKPCKHGHLGERLVSNGRCCECHAARQLKVYHDQTPEQKLAFNRLNARPWEKRKAASYRYEQKKYASDLDYRLLKCLRARFYKAMSRNQRAGTTLALVGCDAAVLRAHLESQFEEGMSWDNFGQWEVDHVRPCASFDLSDPEQQQACFHYRNLQPLWKEVNRRKAAKLVT
jgi:hypothetical protein